jgi:hypothetical protein
MKNIVFLLIFPLTFCLSAKGATIIIEGKYQNKNLYVQNGFNSSGVGFCTYEVTVNGHVTTDELNSSAFEIDFTPFQLKPGTEVIVEIKHKDGCNPKILNPEALKPKATFDLVNIQIDKKGLLKWTTKNESGSLPFIVEQFKWNKWIYISEVKGLGTPTNNEYSFQTTPHSGENKYRVKQVGFDSKPRYADPVSYQSNVPKLTFTAANNSDILFSSETMYEVYDYYGLIVKKGYGKKLDIANLPKGEYYLCFDNTTTNFKKK